VNRSAMKPGARLLASLSTNDHQIADNGPYDPVVPPFSCP